MANYEVRMADLSNKLTCGLEALGALQIAMEKSDVDGMYINGLWYLFDGLIEIAVEIETATNERLKQLRELNGIEIKTGPDVVKRFVPEKGLQYLNLNGSCYNCIGYDDQNRAVMQSDNKFKWTFSVVGCRMYDNGCIDWEYSTNGRFENGEGK